MVVSLYFLIRGKYGKSLFLVLRAGRERKNILSTRPDGKGVGGWGRIQARKGRILFNTKKYRGETFWGYLGGGEVWDRLE